MATNQRNNDNCDREAPSKQILSVFDVMSNDYIRYGYKKGRDFHKALCVDQDECDDEVCECRDMMESFICSVLHSWRYQGLHRADVEIVMCEYFFSSLKYRFGESWATYILNGLLKTENFVIAQELEARRCIDYISYCEESDRIEVDFMESELQRTAAEVLSSDDEEKFFESIDEIVYVVWDDKYELIEYNFPTHDLVLEEQLEQIIQPTITQELRDLQAEVSYQKKQQGAEIAKIKHLKGSKTLKNKKKTTSLDKTYGKFNKLSVTPEMREKYHKIGSGLEVKDEVVQLLDMVSKRAPVKTNLEFYNQKCGVKFDANDIIQLHHYVPMIQTSAPQEITLPRWQMPLKKHRGYKFENMDEAWENCLKDHYARSEHHPEHFQGLTMTARGTLEMMFDLWSCALRQRKDFVGAYDMFITWMCDDDRGKLTLKSKFANVNPVGLLMFYSTIKRCGIPTKDNNFIQYIDQMKKRPLSDAARNANWIDLINNKCKDRNFQLTSIPEIQMCLLETREHMKMVDVLMNRARYEKGHDYDKLFVDKVIAYTYKFWVQPKLAIETSKDCENCENPFEHDDCFAIGQNFAEKTRQTLTSALGSVRHHLFSGTCDMIKQHLPDGFCDTIAKIGNGFAELTTTIKAMVVRIKELLTPLLKFLGLEKLKDDDLMSKCVDLVKYYIVYINTDSTILKTVTIITTLHTLGIFETMMERFFEVEGKIEICDTDIVETSGWDILTKMTSLFKNLLSTNPRIIAMSLTTVAFMFFGYKIFNSDRESLVKKFTETMKCTHFIGGGILGLTRIFDVFVNVIKVTFDYIRKKYFNQLSDDEEENERVQKIVEEFTTWMSEVEIVSMDEYLQLLHSIRPMQARAETIYPKGLEFCKLKAEGKLPVDCARTLFDLMKKARLIENTLVRTRCTEGYRTTPYHLQLVGEVGAGKSTLIRTIVDHIRTNFYPDRENMVYTQGDTDHFDGYNDQPVWLVDDMFPADDYKLAIPLLTLVSNCPLELPMARLENKGRKFTSPFIISTTNTPYPRFGNLFNHQAIWRRRHLLVEVNIDQKVKNKSTGAFDKVMFEKHYPGQSSDTFPHLKFSFINPMDEQKTYMEEEKPNGLIEPIRDLSYTEFLARYMCAYIKFSEAELGFNSSDQFFKTKRMRSLLREIDPVYENLKDRVEFLSFNSIYETNFQTPSKNMPTAAEQVKVDIEIEPEKIANMPESDILRDHSDYMHSLDDAAYTKCHNKMCKRLKFILNQTNIEFENLSDYLNEIYMIFIHMRWTDRNAGEKSDFTKLAEGIYDAMCNICCPQFVSETNLTGKMGEEEWNNLFDTMLDEFPLEEIKECIGECNDIVYAFSSIINLFQRKRWSISQKMNDVGKLLEYFTGFSNYQQIWETDDIMERISKLVGEQVLVEDELDEKLARIHLALKFVNKGVLPPEVSMWIQKLNLSFRNYTELQAQLVSYKSSNCADPKVVDIIEELIVLYKRLFEIDTALTDLKRRQRIFDKKKREPSIVFGAVRDTSPRFVRICRNMKFEAVCYLQPGVACLINEAETLPLTGAQIPLILKGQSACDFTQDNVKYVDTGISLSFLSKLKYKEENGIENWYFDVGAQEEAMFDQYVYVSSYGYYFSKSAINYYQGMKWFRKSVDAFTRLSQRERFFLYNTYQQHCYMINILKTLYAKIERNAKVVYKTIWDKITGAAAYVWNKFKQFKKAMMLATGAIAIVGACTAFAKLFYPKETSAPHTTWGKTTKFHTFTEDTLALNRRIIKGIHRVAVDGTEVQGFAVCAKTLLIPYHCIRRHVKEGKKFFALSYALNGGITMHTHLVSLENNVIHAKGTDTAFVHHPDFPQWPDLTKYLYKEEDFDVECGDVVYMPFIKSNELIVATQPYLRTESKKEMIVNTGDRVLYNKVFCFRGKMVAGSSGAPVIIPKAHAQNPRVVAGFQSFHDSSNSYCTAVTQELVAEMRKLMPQYPAMAPPLAVETMEPRKYAKELVEDHLTLVGHSCPQNILFVGDQTEIIPTPISAYFPAKRIPAVLSARDPRACGDPVKHSLNKHGRDQMIPLDPELLEETIDEYCLYIKSLIYRKTTKPLCVLNITQAILGLRNAKHINLNTSPGIPYVWQRGNIPGKKKWIEIDEEGKLSKLDPAFVHDVIMTISSFEKKQIPSGQMMEVMKDELRPICKALGLSEEQKELFYDAKVNPLQWPQDRVLKTRTITVMPMTATVIYRCYNLDLFERLASVADGTTEFCVGINMDSPAAYKMLSRWSELNDRGFDLDIGNWDGHMQPALFRATTELVNRLYDDGEENKNVRITLDEQAMFGFVQYRDIIYQKNWGLPSGYPGTADRNTIAHGILGLYIYKKIMITAKRASLSTMTAKLNHSVSYYYGDDCVTVVSREIEDVYNGETVAEVYKSYGWPVTSADKTKGETIEKFRPLKDLQFLKRQLDQHPTQPFYVRAKIEKETIENLCTYIRKSIEPRAQLYTNLYQALEFAADWGREYYEGLHKRINESLISIGYEGVRLPYVTCVRVKMDRYLTDEALPVILPFAGTAEGDQLYVTPNDAWNDNKSAKLAHTINSKSKVFELQTEMKHLNMTFLSANTNEQPLDLTKEELYPFADHNYCVPISFETAKRSLGQKPLMTTYKRMRKMFSL